MKALLFISLLLFLFACGEPENFTALRDKDVNNLVGRKISIQGQALNFKIGAVVKTQDQFNIFIEDMHSWPEEFWLPEDSAKLVRVTGKLVIRKDLPVFIPKEGDPERQGIPVPEGTDLEEARKRYVLKNAQWELVEK